MTITLVLDADELTPQLLKLVDAAGQVAAMKHPSGAFEPFEPMQLSANVSVYRWQAKSEPATSIELVEDTSIPALWIAVDGPDEDNLARTVQTLRNTLPIIPTERLISNCSGSDASPSALLHAALGFARCGEPPEMLLSAIRAFLKRTDTASRFAACLAAALVKAHAIIPDLESIVSEDADETIQQAAEVTINRIQEP
jgi:hypothetical protein